MFAPNSRYYTTPVYQLKRADRSRVSLVQFPDQVQPALIGYHRPEEGQRLDLIASYYLKDPTAFWQICKANAALSPHALAVHSLIGIPGEGR
jgi:hypothetical protein